MITGSEPRLCACRSQRYNDLCKGGTIQEISVSKCIDRTDVVHPDHLRLILTVRR